MTAKRKFFVLVYAVSLTAFAVLSAVFSVVRHGGLIDAFYISHFFGYSFRFPVYKLLALLAVPYLVAQTATVALFNERKPDDKTGAKAVTSVILSVVVMLASIVSFSASGIRFADDAVSFGADSSPLLVREARYEDVEIYTVKRYRFRLPGKGHTALYYEYSGTAYAIGDGHGHYFDFGELDEASPVYHKLTEIAEQYEKEIETIDCAPDDW